MSQGVEVIGLYVRDQDEALAFYVDKLGLKSYTQVIEVDGAKRIRVRVGPFAAREDAEKAAGTLKAAGLPAAVLTL